MRWSTGSLLVVALTIVTCLPAAAQSPSTMPSVAPSPAPSGIPAPASSVVPFPAPTIPADPELAAAWTVCEGFMDNATLSTAFGQPGALVGAGPWPNLSGLPMQQFCAYNLADGTGFALTSHWGGTFPDGQSLAIKWGPANGGHAIAGLPGPAYGGGLVDGRMGLAWTPIIGPELTLVLDVEGFLPDGTAAPLDQLETFARATVSRLPPIGPDPVCTALLAVPAVSSQHSEPSRGAVWCGYNLGGGKAVRVLVEPRIAGDLPSCCDRVPELGKGAWAQQPGRGGKKEPWRIDWIISTGNPALVGRIENGQTATKLLSRAQLIDLALQVTP